MLIVQPGLKSDSQKNVVSAHDLYFYPEESMPCVLASPYCKYDSENLEERRKSHSQASTSGLPCWTDVLPLILGTSALL